ncbi:MAG: biotin transporter BioY [Clostridia bacterium]|nr:biotin transporter BioY [Clostridia bacterium]
MKTKNIVFCGIIYFVVSTNSGFYEAFTVCILPFLPGDILKAILTIIITPKLNPVIKKI